MNIFKKIISGGQTGVDRAALDWAIQNNIAHGGWCPKGRRAEDGIIPNLYILQETGSKGYMQRTRWNVRDSDATLIITLVPESVDRSLLMNTPKGLQNHAFMFIQELNGIDK